MGPKSLAPVHVQIMDYIIANPTANYADVAAHFGYTSGWLSQIIHSDAFQAMLAEKQVDMFGDVKLSVKDRITGLAHESLRRLSEKITTEQDTQTVANVADIAIKALGFGARNPTSPAVGAQQNNFFVGSVDKSTLEAARQLLHKPAALPQEVEVIAEPAK